MNVVARGGSLHLSQRLSGVATNAPLGILATFCFARSSAPALPPKANVERFVLWHNGQPKRATHSAYNLTAPRCPDAANVLLRLLLWLNAGAIRIKHTRISKSSFEV